MLYIALLLLAFIQVVLGIVLSYKKHNIVSRSFIYFTFALFIWTLANTMLAYTVKNNLSNTELRLLVLNWSNRIGFASGTITLTTLYKLVLVFPVERKKSRLSAFTILLGALVGLVALTPVVAGSYIFKKDSSDPVYVYGSLSNIVTFYYLLVTAETVRSMISVLRKSSSRLIKSQVKTILSALLMTAGLAVLIIIVLPLITGSDSYIVLGYFAPYIFAAAIFYSIFRQGFLNFQALIARSVGYILTMGVVTLGFVGVLTLIAKSFTGGRINWAEAISFALLSLIMIVTYRPIKRFFDKITNKIFYRDAYDTQVLLNEFNETLISTIELEKLLSRAGAIIERYLKPTYCSFGIVNNSDNTVRIIGKMNSDMTKDALNKLRLYMGTNKNKLLVSDLLGEDHNDLQASLQEIHAGLIVKIAKDKEKEGSGYVILGYKKSGNLYSPQDLAAVEIVTNELLIAIENALRFEEIQNFAKTLQEKVDEATRQLRQTNEKLKQMDQTKDDFISMASHQLRTPLTSVKGYVSMVMEGDAGKITAQQRKLLDQAFISSQRMVYLIADLLNVSRLRTGKFIIEAKPTNLADVVEGEISQLIETAKGRDLELTYKKPKDFPLLMLDDTKIRQVIMNFADNAIYYTPAGGHIQVALEDKGETIEFTVNDDGIGVPKSEQHHLFGKFYRAGNAKKARPDGTGLGLFMAKKVIIAQGGAIIFHTQEGKGSTFGFSFAKAALSPDHYKGVVSENAVK